MASIRQKQIGELIRRNISTALQQEGRYIYGSEVLVTVTKVEVSPDISTSKVYLSVYNTENKQEVLLQMEENYYQFKQSMSQRLRKQLRRIPEFNFFLDDTLDEMEKINKLFDRLYDSDQMGESE